MLKSGGEMLTQEDFRKALETEIQKAGSQTALAEKLGMTQSQISDYVRGRFPIEKMTVGNLFKLFPSTKINLLGDEIKDAVAKFLEDELLKVHRHLSPDQKVKCLAFVAAHFPEKFKSGAEL